MKAISLVAMFGMLFTNLGCGSLGNILIGHHPKSMATENELATIEFFDNDPKIEGTAALGGAAAAVAGVLIPMLVGEVQKGIEKEAKRYEATYSGRGSAIAFGCNAKKRKPVWMRFTNTVEEDDKRVKTVKFDLKIEPADMDDPATIRILPKNLQIDRTASKIAWASLWPSHWLSTIVWGPWYLFNSGIAKVEMNAQLDLEIIGVDDKGKASAFTLGTIDFPLGKVAAKDLGNAEKYRTSSNDDFLKQMTSPYMIAYLGKCPDGPGAGTGEIVLNARMTFMEANDFGDIIAKGAAKSKERNEDASKKLLELLGVED